MKVMQVTQFKIKLCLKASYTITNDRTIYFFLMPIFTFTFEIGR